jgi:hypothetical protein
LLLPNPEPFAPGSTRENAFFYAGAIIALAYVTSSTQPFRFVRFLWNFLTGRAVRLTDIEAIDGDFARAMRTNTAVGNFQVQNSLGLMVDLVPNGSQIPITPGTYEDYVRRCREFRLAEFLPAMKAIANGFWLIFPKNAAELLCPDDLEELVCGSDQCPVDELKKHCRIDRDPFQRASMFWRVMASFSPQERLQFIGFASGRGGLPPPGASWDTRIRIDFGSSRSGLPTAATCCSSISIPSYASEEEMAANLRIAFSFGGVISDGAMDLSEIAGSF